MTVFGTRPEAIKMAPIIHEMAARGIPYSVCVTGQHREMLRQMLGLFDIKPNYDLDIMTSGQTLEDITARIITGMRDIYLEAKPSLVLIQGDTTTTFAAALAAFYQQIDVGHVEAGLRTDNRYDPFPEEINRRLNTQLSTLHFAPTPQAAENLRRDGVGAETITTTGNTVIDSLMWVAERDRAFESEKLRAIMEKLPTGPETRMALVTSHRRENLGERMENIFGAIRKLAEEESCEFIFPVHLNPKVQEHAHRVLGNLPNVHLIEPLSYSDLVGVMKRSTFVMTDSGGIQEEAPALGKPVMVLRETTERPEGVEAGTAVLVGSADADKIYETAKRLLHEPEFYDRMAHAVNPYGDGSAARQTVDAIEKFYA
jgi:UDP-N-acetylglucosamine 2-epimerase (non-hydrolysing)